MKRTLLILSALVVALGGYACSKEKTEAPEAKESAPAAKESAPAAKEEAAAPEKKEEAAGTQGQIGVPECDEYVSKVQKCVADKVPAAAQAMMKESFDKNIDAWKQAASTPQGKASLATACKTALDAVKQSLGAYGCQF